MLEQWELATSSRNISLSSGDTQSEGHSDGVMWRDA